MSEVINKNKYLDLTGLKKYDELIKSYINTGNSALSDAIASLSEKIGSLDFEGSDDKNLSEVVSEIYSAIADIIVEQESLVANDEELTKQIEIISESLEYITGSSSDNAASIDEINDKISTIQTELSSITASLNKNSEDISAAIQAAADAKSYADTLDAAMDERVKALEKIDHDAIVAEAVATVVAGADSDFDTLKDVADWIRNDKTGAAALQVTVSEHTESINTLTGDLDALETKVDDDIQNLTDHITDAATALSEIDGRLNVLEAFEETHASIPEIDIESLFDSSEEE